MAGDTPSGLRVAVVGGVPVYVGASWAVIALVVVVLFGPQVDAVLPELGTARAYVVAGVYAVLLLLSVLAHEAAHAIVATRMGYRVRQVVADLWGGHTAYEAVGGRPGASALVAVCGPLANAVLALVGWLLLPHAPTDAVGLVLGAVVWTNSFVALFNLLPGLPLDGGFLVEAAVWKATGSRDRGMLVAGWTGRVVAVLAILVALGWPLLQGRSPSLFTVVWAGFIGAFLWSGATQAIRSGRFGTRLGRIPVSAVWRPVAVVPGQATAGEVLRRLAGPGGAGATVVVLDRDGAPVGIADPDAVRAIPADRLDTTTIAATTRGQPAGWVLDGTPEESVVDVVGLMQQLGSGTVLVRLPGGQIAGIVYAADVDSALSATGR